MGMAMVDIAIHVAHKDSSGLSGRVLASILVGVGVLFMGCTAQSVALALLVGFN